MNESAQNITSQGFRIGVEERIDSPGTWTVEAIGSDGEIYQALFIGPEARERAEEYATLKYSP